MPRGLGEFSIDIDDVKNRILSGRSRDCGILRRRLHSGRCGREDLLRRTVSRRIDALLA
jgi:hypothetical protein